MVTLGAAETVDGFKHRETGYHESSKLGLAMYSGHITLPLRGIYDVAVFAWEARCATLPLAIARCRMAGLGVVLWGQGFSKSSSKSIGKLVRNQVALAADAIVVYDDETAKNLQQLGKPVFVARNTIQVPQAQRLRARDLRSHRLAQAESKTFQKRPLSVIVCTRLQQRNRIDLLADASKLYAETYGPIKVTLIGADHWPGGIKSLRGRFGSAEWRVLGPIYDPDRLANLYANADLAVVPDAVGLSLIHALAHGVPFITAAGLGPHGPEFSALKNGQNGLLYIRGDSNSLCEMLFRGKSFQFLQDAGHAAADTYDGRYSPSAMVDGLMAAIYKSHWRRFQKSDENWSYYDIVDTQLGLYHAGNGGNNKNAKLQKNN
ncbi:MAG: glycosyltransferase [Spirochaetales bacterium]|nr:glycosyltransferase [Spirochaetales bacterium]